MSDLESNTTFLEEELLPLSAVADVMFCRRRAGLHLVERVWEDNVSTVEGTSLHQKVDRLARTQSHSDSRIARGLWVRSLRLGLVGKADVVEFHRLTESSLQEVDGSGLAAGITLTGVKGLWRPFPVEYKVGRRRHEEGYEVQVCAQALCLEEMLNVVVPAGAIFYAKTGRRLELTFDERLRRRTEEAAGMLHEIIRSGNTPKARYEKKCDKCSLLSQCMPKTTGRRPNVASYLQRAVTEMGRDTK